MTRKQRRAVLIAGGLVMIGLASALVLMALDRQVTFFMSPTDVLANQPAPGTRVRIGGLVEEGTFHRGKGAASTFKITDRAKSLLLPSTISFPICSRKGKVPLPRDISGRTAYSWSTRCSPSTTRNTCHPKSPPPSKRAGAGRNRAENQKQPRRQGLESIRFEVA